MTVPIELRPEAEASELHRPATLADEFLIEALPADTRAAIRRLYGPLPLSGKSYAVKALALAYERGWEDAMEEVEVRRPASPQGDRVADRVMDIVGRALP